MNSFHAPCTDRMGQCDQAGLGHGQDHVAPRAAARTVGRRSDRPQRGPGLRLRGGVGSGGPARPRRPARRTAVASLRGPPAPSVPGVVPARRRPRTLHRHRSRWRQAGHHRGVVQPRSPARHRAARSRAGTGGRRSARRRAVLRRRAADAVGSECSVQPAELPQRVGLAPRHGDLRARHGAGWPHRSLRHAARRPGRGHQRVRTAPARALRRAGRRPHRRLPGRLSATGVGGRIGRRAGVVARPDDARRRRRDRLAGGAARRSGGGRRLRVGPRAYAAAVAEPGGAVAITRLA